MSWIDIVIIAIVAICALIGIGKGTYKSLMSLFGSLFALIAAFFLTKVIAFALLEIEAVNNLVFNTIYNGLYEFAGTLANPEAFYYPMIKPILDLIATSSAGISQAQGIALYLSYLIACLAVFIVLFIILKIVAMIIFKIIGSLINGESPGFPSRVVGMVIGAVKGALYVVMITLIFTFSIGFSFVKPVAEEIKKSTIAVHVYDAVEQIKTQFFADEDSDTMTELIRLSGIEAEVEGEETEE